MAPPLVFYFDFASPYAWIAFDEVTRIAAQAGRKLELRPVLLWAILREQDIPAPLEPPARRDYMLADMARSAEFMGVELRLPTPLPISAHLASRLWLGMVRETPERAVEIARHIFALRFVEGRDIRQREILQDVARAFGVIHDTADQLMDSPENREALAAANAQAVADGACGVPFFVLDGEGFFGADRLPQIRWRLGWPGGPEPQRAAGRASLSAASAVSSRG